MSSVEIILLVALAASAHLTIVRMVVRAHTLERQLLLSLLHDADQTAAIERRELLNRIDPSTAQWGPMEHTVPEVDIPLEDDEQYAMLANMSKEQLAEMADH